MCTRVGKFTLHLSEVLFKGFSICDIVCYRLEGVRDKMITLSKKLKQGAPVKKEEESKRISIRDKLLVKGKFIVAL